MSCLFYGRAYYAGHQFGPNPPFVLVPTGGNQCALVSNAHAPCLMERDGETPDQEACVLVKHIRCEEID